MKLHLGCGKRELNGFLHIDIADFPHISHRSSVDNLDFIKSETVDEIYTSHTFEYFDRVEANSVLMEWNRVLKPNGQLYITVPDFDKLILIYKESKELQSITGPLFGRWTNPNSSILLFHKTVWNFSDLTDALKINGFEDVKKFDPVNYLQQIDPSYDDHSLAFYPHMDRSGIQVSLAVCAVKNKQGFNA